ncbi:toxin-antitoxin system YwqK family antitoxin [Gillisia sp. Hel_I_86]|uniref:toxin-antitoxin system YwqK family antitoxin n=1 Tax=Gillisia sp. Hel_I_86 TaxID=1249981 RepID=UPI0011AA04BD|nr:toxin-antitoxin system YwqK family antitoxin [Gillisia sp. Hel_I_86]
MNYTTTNITSYFREHTKEHQVQLIKFLSITGLVMLSACQKQKADVLTISDFQIDKAELQLKPLEGKWYYAGKAFNGFAISYYPTGRLESRIGYFDGKKQGEAKLWYANGTLAKQSFYNENQLDGALNSYWPDGSQSAQSNYRNSVRHGVQKKWFASGQLARKTTYQDGQESGLQQAWLENGKIYVNYEAKHGRVFGMKRTNLCYQLKDENVQYQ